MMVDDKERSLKKTLSDIEKTINLSISKIKDRKKLDVEVIPSGSYTLDDALGVGGWPRGRIVEIFGREAGGKTLISLLAIAEAQKLGGKAAFIDVEHAFDPTWAKKLGVDVDNLFFTQPDYGEQALEAVHMLVKTNEFDVIVVDSTASLVSKEELEANIEDHKIAQTARMMSRALKVLTPAIGKSKAIVLFINQTRTNPLQLFGNPETTPGGAALKFYCSLRVNVNKKGGSDIKQGQQIIGHTTKIRVVKNKVAPPFREAEFKLRYDIGVDRIDELATLAIDRGVVEQKGPMYHFQEASWKGRAAFVEELTNVEDLRKAIWEELRKPSQ